MVAGLTACKVCSGRKEPLLLLGEQRQCSGVRLRTACAAPCCKSSARGMVSALKSAEMVPGRAICSLECRSSQRAAAEAYRMACAKTHQLLPRILPGTLLYFQNTFFYLNNEGTGECL